MGSTPPSKMKIEKGKKYKFQVRRNDECCGDNDYYVFHENDDKLAKVLKIDLPESDHQSVEGDKIYIKYPEENDDGEMVWKKSKCQFKVKEQDEQTKKNVDSWDSPDSDSSDYSEDDWYFRGGDDKMDQAEVQLKWKIACVSKIYQDDSQVGKIKLKAKGKCKCEVWKEWRERRKPGSDPENPEMERQKVEQHDFSGRPKICKIKAYQCGEDDDEPYKLDIDQKKSGWHEGRWDREWRHDDFKTTFQLNGWNPECEVKVDSEELEPLVMLAQGFIVGYQQHPQMFDKKMKDNALGIARRYAREGRRRRPSRSNSSDRNSLIQMQSLTTLRANHYYISKQPLVSRWHSHSTAEPHYALRFTIHVWIH